MMMTPGVLMSIHPQYADAILAGTKTVELRRRRPSFLRPAERHHREVLRLTRG
jgi:hypothetical protein